MAVLGNPVITTQLVLFDDLPAPTDLPAGTDLQTVLETMNGLLGTGGDPDKLVLQLTNKSGGSVAAGDVVVIDTANNTAFTTTTTGRATISLGIAQETIASNATGSVLIAGYAALVNVSSSVTRGHYVETTTVAKQAVGNSARRSGSFGQFLTGGTTPTAWLWGVPDQSAGSGGGPFEEFSANWWNMVTGVDTISDATEEAYHYMSGGYHEIVSGDVATGEGWIKLAPNNYSAGGPATAKVIVEGGHGLVFPSLTADPAGGNSENGQVYYNSTSNKLRVRAAGSWVDLH